LGAVAAVARPVRRVCGRVASRRMRSRDSPAGRRARWSSDVAEGGSDPAVCGVERPAHPATWRAVQRRGGRSSDSASGPVTGTGRCAAGRCFPSPVPPYLRPDGVSCRLYRRGCSRTAFLSPVPPRLQPDGVSCRLYRRGCSRTVLLVACTAASAAGRRFLSPVPPRLQQDGVSVACTAAFCVQERGACSRTAFPGCSSARRAAGPRILFAGPPAASLDRPPSHWTTEPVDCAGGRWTSNGAGSCAVSEGSIRPRSQPRRRQLRRDRRRGRGQRAQRAAPVVTRAPPRPTP
jgi:hypothetical protein